MTRQLGQAAGQLWKLAFRVTAAAAALLIAPFLADESVQRTVSYGLAVLPFLAIVVIAGGLFHAAARARPVSIA